MNLIPKPLSCIRTQGFFSLKETSVPEVFQELFSSVSSYFGSGECKFQFNNDSAMEPEEYRLEIAPEGILITSSTSAGAFYAAVTLKQILLEQGPILPATTVCDKPNLPIRGYMLDVSRYFFTVDEVKRQIDYLSTLKYNRFHWHLTDDQGWRVEIKKYPKLTEKGSKRNRMLFRLYPQRGYYSQEEIKEIVSYAHSRHMKVVPEIDLPGHFSAALAAYPEYGCAKTKCKVQETFGVKFNVACIGNPATVPFLCDILDELIELFPDGEIHLGGDEVPSYRWKLCPDCQKVYEEKGCKDYLDFEAVLLNDLAAHLKERGVTATVWHNPMPSLSPDIIDQVWCNQISYDHLAETPRKLLNSYSNYFYFDFPYALAPLKQTYEAPLTLNGKDVIGLEGCMWTELVPNQAQAERISAPRLLATAEKGWTNPDIMDYNDFIARCRTFPYYRHIGMESYPESRWNPTGISAMLDRIWWERRQLYWGAIGNLYQNIRAKHSIIRRKNKL